MTELLSGLARKVSMTAIFVRRFDGRPCRSFRYSGLLYESQTFSGLLEREERPWFEARTLGENSVLLSQSLLRMSAIAIRYRQITIVPSHDPRGYASIPEFSRSATR
jgi:hypothetical protein